MVADFALGIMLAVNAAGSCRAVDGDRILAADLAREIPAFSAVPAKTEVAFAPAPGARRLFPTPELRRLADRLGVSASEMLPVCFTRRMEPLDPERVRAAIEEALGDAKARLEVIEYLRTAVPVGRLEFPRTGLARSHGGTVAMWRGRIRYGGGHSYPVWARVRVNLERSRVVALRTLPVGKPVPADAVEVRKVSAFPFDEEAPATVAEVEGRLPRRTIVAGQVVEARQLTFAPDVEAGAAVEVQARSGATSLSFSAKAESPGRAGDMVVVRNPGTGKRFRARVEGKGRVSVDEPTGDEHDAESAESGRGSRAGSGSSASRQEE